MVFLLELAIDNFSQFVNIPLQFKLSNCPAAQRISYETEERKPHFLQKEEWGFLLGIEIVQLFKYG